jgi:uncharacterized protein (DUF1330 family)
MKTRYVVGMAMLAGIGVGAVAVQVLHAQAKPPAYVVAEIDVIDQEGYAKEYQPAAIKAINPKFLSRGSNSVSFRGEPPKRIVIFAFENMDKAREIFTSAAYNEAWTIGSKYAKFRIYAVEGVSP